MTQVQCSFVLAAAAAAAAHLAFGLYSIVVLAYAVLQCSAVSMRPNSLKQIVCTSLFKRSLKQGSIWHLGR